jgi:hypothetical protein
MIDCGRERILQVGYLVVKTPTGDLAEGHVKAQDMVFTGLVSIRFA